MQNKITLDNLPLCTIHKNKSKYICQEQNCNNNFLNCGDCLFDFHGDHIKKVIRIEDILKDLNDKYQILQSKTNLQIDIQESVQSLTELSELDEVSEKFYIKFGQSVKSILNLIKKGSESKIIQLQSLTSGDYTNLLTFFEQFSDKDIPYLNEKILIAQKLQENMAQIEKNSNDSKYLREKVEKMKKQFVSTYQSFEKSLNEVAIKYRKEFQIIIDDDMFNYKKLQYWNCEFDSSKLNKLTLESNNKLKLMTTPGCSKDKKAISLEKIPQGGQVYWEIIKSHTHGCYDSIGVCTKYVQRNGTTASGWAVRCYGAHSDFEFTGAWHNNIKTKFYEKWTTNSKIGLLYNSQTKSLSFFDNQIYVGTPFTNIEGEELYFLVEGCHLGSFEIIHDAELPSDIEIEKIESKSQPIY